jgi:hypothetical protein
VAQVIGNAADFYRLRVIHVDEGEAPDMEWRDDILYRSPQAVPPEEYDVWRVEAVDLADEETVAVVGAFDTNEDAERWLDTVADDLSVMTKSEFERTYFKGQDDAPDA